MTTTNDFGTLPPIPVPQLQVVENTTPYLHLAFDKMGKGRLFYDVVVCKATFTLAPGKLQPAEQALPIELADRYWNEEAAQTSSVKVAGDVVLTKPGTDILITGTAHTFDGQPRERWWAGVCVAKGKQVIVEHQMHLHGPRAWQHRSLLGWTLSRPEPTISVALRHELAYGGYHRNPQPKEQDKLLNTFAANPAGCGYWDPKQLDKSVPYLAPQIDTPEAPISKMGVDYPLAAPAPLARFWADRTRYGGTYDDAWQQQFHASAIPDFPHDFDNRFFQCAHPKLIAANHLQGDECIYLAGMVPGHSDVLMCELPAIRLHADMTAADGRTGRRSLALDTVHIDLVAGAVALTWRLTLDQRTCIEHVRLVQEREGQA